MFARKLRIILSTGDSQIPVPQAWLDQFFLRDFTGCSAFDETLPAADGVLECGFRVDAADVQTQFEKWLRGRKAIPPETDLVVGEEQTLRPRTSANSKIVFSHG